VGEIDLPDSDTIYFIVFGVIAFLVVVRFGRKDKAAFKESKNSAMEDVKRSLADSPAEQKRDESDDQNPSDKRR